MANVTRVFLVRHGQTEWNLQNRLQGQQNSPLTKTGKEQAREVRNSLADLKIHKAYVSPLQRARDTIAIVLHDRTVEIVSSSHLKEIKLGPWEGKTRKEAEQSHPIEYHNFCNDPGKFSLPGAETFLQLQARVVAELNKFFLHEKGKDILVVSHWIAIKVAIAHYTSIPLNQLSRIPEPSNGSILSFVLSNNGISIHNFENDDISPSMPLKESSTLLTPTQIPEDSTDRSESSMKSYYSKRAPIYDAVYAYPERQQDLRFLEHYIAEQLTGLNVLEIAAGTGYWTQYIATQAKSILATDVTIEPLNQIGMRVTSIPIQVKIVSAYLLSELDQKFNGAFAGLWFSHVPKQRRHEFLESLHQVLTSSAKVLFIDNSISQCKRLPLSYTDEFGNTYQDRVLEDGTTHRILKNFPTEEELVEVISDFGSGMKFRQLDNYQCLLWGNHLFILEKIKNSDLAVSISRNFSKADAQELIASGRVVPN